MEFYKLLEPVEEKGDFFVDSQVLRAFSQLNKMVGEGFNKSKNFIIEIVGTSAIGKTSFKNILINCLQEHNKFKVFHDNYKGTKTCPNELNSDYFSNFKGKNNAIIFEYNFNIDPDPARLKNDIKELNKKVKDIQYIYVFFDEFEYYFLYRKNLKKVGKIKNEEELDIELYDALNGLTVNSDKTRIILFILTPVYFWLPIKPEEKFKDRYDIVAQKNILHFRENFKLMLFDLNITTTFTINWQDDQELKEFWQKITGNQNSYEELVRNFKELVKMFFNEGIEIPVYYLKYLLILYFLSIKSDKNFKNARNMINNKLEEIHVKREEYLAGFDKSRERKHFMYLIPQIIEDAFGIDKEKLRQEEIWNLYQKIMDKNIYRGNFFGKKLQMITHLRRKSVIFYIEEVNKKIKVINLFRNLKFDNKFLTLLVPSFIKKRGQISKAMKNLIKKSIILSLIVFITPLTFKFVTSAILKENGILYHTYLYYMLIFYSYILDAILIIKSFNTLLKPTEQTKRDFVALVFYMIVLSMFVYVPSWLVGVRINMNVILVSILIYLITLTFIIITPVKNEGN